MNLPESIKANLPKVEGATIYGKPILDYSKEELAAYIIWQEDQSHNAMIEKHEQLRKFRKRERHLFAKGG